MTTALYNTASHSPIHTPPAGRPCQATASWPGAVRVRCLAQGHLGTWSSREANQQPSDY